MKKTAIFMAVLFVLPCLAGPRARQDGTLPPTESHGQRISRYGCDIMLLPGAPHDATHWALTVWAEYGSHNRRYWQTFLGKYNTNPGVRVIESLGQPAWKDGPVGPVVTSFGSTGANQACAEWSEKVRSRIIPKAAAR